MQVIAVVFRRADIRGVGLPKATPYCASKASQVKSSLWRWEGVCGRKNVDASGVEIFDLGVPTIHQAKAGYDLNTTSRLTTHQLYLAFSQLGYRQSLASIAARF